MTTAIVVLLVAVDLTALAVGLSIRRKVTRIISETAADIETAVKGGIADAVGRIAQLAQALVAGDANPARRQLVDQAAELVDQLRQ